MTPGAVMSTGIALRRRLSPQSFGKRGDTLLLDGGT